MPSVINLRQLAAGITVLALLGSGGAATAAPPPSVGELKAAVHMYLHCLHVISSRDAAVLRLATGLGGNPLLDQAHVAADLRLPLATVAASEARLPAELSAAAARTGCGGSSVATSSLTAKPSRAARASDALPGVASSSWGRPSVLALLGIAAGCLLGVVWAFWRVTRA